MYVSPNESLKEAQLAISFPRKAYQPSCGLVGKLHINSEMSEEDVRSEICWPNAK